MNYYDDKKKSKKNRYTMNHNAGVSELTSDTTNLISEKL